MSINICKQAGAELCQAQTQVGLPAETRFNKIPDVLEGYIDTQLA